MTEDAETHAAGERGAAGAQQAEGPRAGPYASPPAGAARVREALLLDLGATVYELHRQGRREPELLQAKAAELAAVDDEVRGLAEALERRPRNRRPGGRGRRRQLRELRLAALPGLALLPACGTAVS